VTDLSKDASMNARRLVPLRAPRALALALALCLAPTAARADEASLKAEIAELRAQLAALQAQMKTFADRAAVAPPPAAPALAARVDQLEQATAKALQFGDTTLSSYGEASYARPRSDADKTEADLVRAVIGFQHRFDDRTRVVGEFEWEHAVTSADDKGETAVEQLYVELLRNKQGKA